MIYDRASSAISEMEPDAVDWTDGVRRRRSGSTSPASRPRSAPTARPARRRALEAARAAGARVSVDLNFRKKLWTEKQAQAGRWAR